MALITCPECSHNVSDKALSCPGCGYPLQTAAVKVVKPKSRPKLPNGYGSVKKLSGNRKRPYAAYPPVTEFHLTGSAKLGKAIGYFAKYNEAYAALTEWHRLQGKPVIQTENSTIIISGGQMEMYKSSLTFAQVYDMYYKDKYQERPGKKKLSVSSQNATKAAYKNCSKLHDRIFASLVTRDLQAVIDECPFKYSSLELIVNLFKQMYSYAIQNDLTDKDYGKYVKINIPDDDVSGVPFSPEEIKILWEHSDQPYVQIILIMIYSGFRIAAYEHMEINKEEEYFRGGVKTKSSKDRMVPIHKSILPFVEQLATFRNAAYFRTYCFTPALESLGILYAATGEKHTPHDCRHTFSWLCDEYHVDSVSKHLMMGHALQGDVETRKYSHRTLDQLRAEINKITL